MWMNSDRNPNSPWKVLRNKYIVQFAPAIFTQDHTRDLTLLRIHVYTSSVWVNSVYWKSANGEGSPFEYPPLYDFKNGSSMRNNVLQKYNFHYNLPRINTTSHRTIQQLSKSINKLFVYLKAARIKIHVDW